MRHVAREHVHEAHRLVAAAAAEVDVLAAPVIPEPAPPLGAALEGSLEEIIVRMGRFPHSDCPHPDEPELVERCLDTVGALHLIDRLHQGLSGGEKARVQLARVLAQVTPRPGDTPDPQPSHWLLLDEPTAALDLAHQHSVMRLLRQLAAQGFGIVVVLHDLNLAQAYADQALVLRDGRLDTLGRCDDVLQPKLIQRIWGVLCDKLPRPGQAGSWLALSSLASGVTE